jgi:hypothetical protein
MDEGTPKFDVVLGCLIMLSLTKSHLGVLKKSHTTVKFVNVGYLCMFPLFSITSTVLLIETNRKSHKITIAGKPTMDPG